MKKLYVVVLLALVLSLFAACSGNKPTTLANADFKITGNVGSAMGWSDKDMRAMDTTDAVKENKDGSKVNCTGVALTALFDMVKVDGGAATVTFVAADGYSADAPLVDLQACADCIVSFQDDGEGFDMVLPDFAGKVNVKDVTEITIQ